MLKKIISFPFVITCLLFVFSCSKTESFTINSNTSFDTDSSYILIDLRGEVMYPRVYQVEKGILLDDLIKLAGGTTMNANLDSINLVEELNENIKIVIPSKDKIVVNNNLININSATKEELMQLPNIGSSKASAIIEYRNTNGYFYKVEEILKVNGISDALYEKIKEFICI